MEAAPLIVDKPSVCQRGLPGRLSSHCSSIQHGRSTALTSSLVALPASLGLLRPVSRTARGLRAPRLRWPSVPALRTACARASSPSGLQRPATGTGMHFSVSHRPALRLRGVPCLRTSCARHFSPSGLHLFASICIHSSQSSICIARKLACSSRCSLGSLRPVSATGGGLRAPRKKCQK